MAKLLHQVVAVTAPGIKTIKMICSCGYVKWLDDNDKMQEHIKKENKNKGDK